MLTKPLSGKQAEAAAETSRRITELLQDFAGRVDRFVLRAEGGGPVALAIPEAAMELLRDILDEMGRGNAVTVMPVNAELTTQEAAEMLNVSRPYVIKLLKEGKIPYKHVGSHRRIRLEDLRAYQDEDDARRRALLDELAAEAQEMGIGYK